jgi:hypothetical protein
MTFTTTTYPVGPYTYDDPRITYNEKCFFYNGGFELTCLIQDTVRHHGGGQAIGKMPTGKVYPQVDVINLIFKTCIEYVNDKSYKDEEVCEIKRYQFQKDVSEIKIKTTSMNVKRRLFTITSDEFNVNTISRFLDKDNKPTSIVSSSLSKLSTKVSSSLHFNKLQKIKINSAIIKVKDKE